MPLLAVAEHTHSTGRDFVTAVVLAYEVYLQFSDVFPNLDFDHTNFCCIGTALAAGKLFGLAPGQLLQAVSMAAVPNVSLRQARMGHQTIWRAGATGQAGRAGVFAAQLARAGLQGACMPFEGEAGWCEHVARNRISLPDVDLKNLKIGQSRFKYRPTAGNTMACVLAAEQVAPIRDPESVQRITVETFAKAVEASGVGEHNTNPTSRESADHSIPYLVAAALLEGTVTSRSFGEGKLWHPKLRELMRKVEVLKDPDLTTRSAREPRYDLARVRVLMRNGDCLTGDAGAKKEQKVDRSEQEMVLEKFRGLTVDYLGVRRVDSILDGLLELQSMPDVASIPREFVMT
jgi:2-methylcitrate dehydratase